jgi:hypothetical protein
MTALPIDGVAVAVGLAAGVGVGLGEDVGVGATEPQAAASASDRRATPGLRVSVLMASPRYRDCRLITFVTGPGGVHRCDCEPVKGSDLEVVDSSALTNG